MFHGPKQNLYFCGIGVFHFTSPPGNGNRKLRRSPCQENPPARSQNVGRQFGQFGALAFLQFDVRGDGLVAEFADDVVEAVGGRIHIRIVNLIRDRR